MILGSKGEWLSQQRSVAINPIVRIGRFQSFVQTAADFRKPPYIAINACNISFAGPNCAAHDASLNDITRPAFSSHSTN